MVWSAVNRTTFEGTSPGPQHKVSLDVALKAITIDAAYSIQQEKKVGSIEVGKDANLTVLEQSSYAVAPEKLKDIKVWGTMLEGRVQPVNLKMPKIASARKSKAPKTAPNWKAKVPNEPVAVSSGDDAAFTRAMAAKLVTLLAHNHNH